MIRQIIDIKGKRFVLSRKLLTTGKQGRIKIAGLSSSR